MMNRIKILAIALTLLGLIYPLEANAFVVDSICYRPYYNTDNQKYEVEVTEHDNFQNYKMYVGDVMIPESVTYESVTYTVSRIESSAFYGSTYLRSVHIPETVQFIDYIADTFYFCTGLESIFVAEQNEAYCDIDGVLFTKDKSTLVTYPVGRYGAYTVPAGVQMIGQVAFYNRRNMTSVTLPESLNEIRVYAFWGCENLKTVISHNPIPPILASDLSDTNINVFGNLKPDTLRVPRAAIEAYGSAGEWSLFAHILPLEGDCDLTGDNTVDVADVNMAIDIMLGDSPQGNSDVTGDGIVDICDVNAIINRMLGKD